MEAFSQVGIPTGSAADPSERFSGRKPMRRTRSVPFRDVTSVEPGLAGTRSAHRTRLRGHRRRPRPAGREGGFPSARSGEVRPEAAEHGLAPTLVWQREGPLVAENHRNQRNGDAARRRRKGDFETRRFPGGQGGPGPSGGPFPPNGRGLLQHRRDLARRPGLYQSRFDRDGPVSWRVLTEIHGRKDASRKKKRGG